VLANIEVPDVLAVDLEYRDIDELRDLRP